METENKSGRKHPVSFIFNSRTLIPWDTILKGREHDDVQEEMILWQEAHMPGHYFGDNDAVANVDNPEQMMRVKRVVRDKNNANRIIGIECWWWMEITIDEVLKVIKKMSDKKPVQGITVLES